eukprot:TRINITY_DN50316_c0_g1_i1.p1 TRINITY_DN50316_c0_g1~~TRINITY_DN50316_c0_g1_i1.p1  ORF type:complete len:828 (+),score=107.74 TRINITY_DN50316_c0_g1_i1:36-2519(+)
MAVAGDLTSTIEPPPKVASLPAPPWAALLRPHVEPALRNLVQSLVTCETVRKCFLSWYFLSEWFGSVKGMFYVPPDVAIDPSMAPPVPVAPHATTLVRRLGVTAVEILVAAAGLHMEVIGRSCYWKSGESFEKHVVDGILDSLSQEQHSANFEEGPPPPHRTAVLVHFAGQTASSREEAQPFIDSLGCFARQQGMAFVHDITPGPRFVWTGKLGGGLARSDAYVVEMPAGLELSAGPNEGDVGLTAVAAMNVSYFTRQLDEIRLTKESLFRRITRRHVWRSLERNLDVISGPPIRWAKVVAISNALERHEAILYFDYDVTIRPDCMRAARFADMLFSRTSSGAKPSIVVRDSPVGVDCLNTGFLAFRRTPAARAFLKQWEAKRRWPGIMHGDQGAFAETLLEFVHGEYKIMGLSHAGSGYGNECVEFLFPGVNGLQSWRSYCDCFQKNLRSLAGDFGDRNSVLVRFINPRWIDLNYIPNSLTPSHMNDLRRMRLLTRRARLPGWASTIGGGRDSNLRIARSASLVPRRLSPLIVHWAGIKNRTRLMRQYLIRRFGVSPAWFHPQRSADQRCLSLYRLSNTPDRTCEAGAGLGTKIEHVFQPPRFYAMQYALAVRATKSPTADLGRDKEADCEDHMFPVTSKFLEDLITLLGDGEIAKQLAVLEIGGGSGYVTSLLAQRFRDVTRIEADGDIEEAVRQFVSGIDNVRVKRLNSCQAESWEVAATFTSEVGGVDLVLIHVSRCFDGAFNLLDLAVNGGLGPTERGGRPRFVALTNYFVAAEVTQAAVDFEDVGLLRFVGPLGHEEGMLCELPAKTGFAKPATAPRTVLP